MKCSFKSLVGLIIVANLLVADFAAASRFGRSSSSSSKSSSYRNSRSSNGLAQKKSSPSNSRFSGRTPITKQAPVTRSPVKRNPVTSKSPIKRSPVTQSPSNRFPVKKSPIVTRPGTSPVTVRQPIVGKGPITGRQPIVGKGPITVRQPVIGKGPIKGREPVQSGDPDAGPPLKQRPVKETEALPSRGEQIVDKTAPITGDKDLLPGTERPDVRQPDNGQEPPSGNFQEGDVISGDGKVVDQEFLDLVNDGEFLHTGQPAPWDNPEDPFWYGEKPVDWKGHWPGKETDPVKDPAPGKNPNPEKDPNPGKDPFPGKNPNPGKDPRPVEDPAPVEEPNPGNEPEPGNDPAPEPDHNDDDHDCPPPVIIIDPTRPCPVPCPPCVAVVCPGVPCLPIVGGPIVGQPIVEEPQAAVLQLIVGMNNTLEAQGLGDVKGAAALEVNGLGLPVPVATWTNEQLVLEVPIIGLPQPTRANLYLFDAEMNIIAEIPVELLTPEMAGIDLEELEAAE